MATIIQKDKTSGPQFYLGYSGLNVSVAGGNANFRNETEAIAPANLSLTPSGTNYIFITWDTGVITSNTAGFPEDCVRLYEIETSASSVVNVKDVKSLMRVSAHTDHITLQTETKNHSTDVWSVIGRALVDCSRYLAGTKMQLIAMAKKDGGGSGYVRLYDYLAAEELAVIEITASSWTVVHGDLTSVPSGYAALELMIRTDGVGVIYCGGASMEVK